MKGYNLLRPCKGGESMVLSISALWSTVQDAIERRDLEGHLAVLVLNTTFQTSGSTVFPSPWTRAVTDLLAIDLIAAGTPRHASDILMLTDFFSIQATRSRSKIGRAHV